MTFGNIKSIIRTSSMADEEIKLKEAIEARVNSSLPGACLEYIGEELELKEANILVKFKDNIVAISSMLNYSFGFAIYPISMGKEKIINKYVEYAVDTYINDNGGM